MITEPERVYAPAARRALDAFGVEPADLRFIRLAENVTFRVTDARDGSLLVLRLHRPWYHDIVALQSEHIWTRALVQAGIAAPEPLYVLELDLARQRLAVGVKSAVMQSNFAAGDFRAAVPDFPDTWHDDGTIEPIVARVRRLGR